MYRFVEIYDPPWIFTNIVRTDTVYDCVHRVLVDIVNHRVGHINHRAGNINHRAGNINHLVRNTSRLARYRIIFIMQCLIRTIV